MGDANRVKVSYVEESTFGAAESGSNLQTLRLNSESLNHDMTTTTSAEMRSDRQISDIARIGLSASGDIAFELSYGSHDDWWKAGLLDSAWSDEAKLTNAPTISFDSSDNSINDSASGFGSFVANSWIRILGATNTANNGFFKIVSATSAKLVVKGGTLVTETAGNAITVQMGSEIVNGTTLVSYNIEKDFEDLSSVLALFLGMCVNTISLDVPADGIITGSFGFLGSEETALTATSGSGYDAVTTTPVMTGANHVPNFMENYADASILNFSMSINNNLRARMIVGTLGVDSIGTGSVEITGSFSRYFTTAALYNKFINQQATSISLVVRDTQGSAYVFDLPSLKITSGARAAGGLNTDVIGEFSWSAYMDPTESITIRIARFPIMDNLSGIVTATSTVTGALTV